MQRWIVRWSKVSECELKSDLEARECASEWMRWLC